MTSERASLPWGWIGFFLVLVLLVLAATLAVLKGAQQLMENEGDVRHRLVWRVIVHGELHLLKEAEFQAFRRRLERFADQRLSALIDESDAAIDREVERAFEPVYAAIPAYADWYYSLSGEYLRYAHALGGDLSVYLTRRLEGALFQQSGADKLLEALPERLQADAARRLRRAGEGLLADAAAELGDRGEPPQEGGEIRWELSGEIPLDDLASAELKPSRGVMERQLVSLGAGLGTGVLVAKGGASLLVKKMVAGIAGSKGFQLAASVLGKLAAKSAAKGGGALAGIGAGTTLCAPGGAVALICGAGAGIATWVAVDMAALQLDEQLHRDQFEASLRQAVAREEAALKRSLQRVHASWFKSRLDAFSRRVAEGRRAKKGYRPIDTLRSY